MFSYRKIGGMHFFRLFSFGFTFYVTEKPVHKPVPVKPVISPARFAMALRAR